MQYTSILFRHSHCKNNSTLKCPKPIKVQKFKVLFAIWAKTGNKSRRIKKGKKQNLHASTNQQNEFRRNALRNNDVNLCQNIHLRSLSVPLTHT